MSCIKLCMHGVRVTERCRKKHLLLCPQKFFEKKRWWSSQISTLPCACIPPLGSSSSHSPHPLLRAPHPISKSIKCVCEAEEAHQLTTAPPPPLSSFFSSSSSRCHRAPASPPLLACLTSSSTLDPGWGWEASEALVMLLVVLVLAQAPRISICADTTKEAGGREPRLLMHLLRLSSSPVSAFFKTIYEQLQLPPTATLSVPSERERERESERGGGIWMSMGHCYGRQNHK